VKDKDAVKDYFSIVLTVSFQNVFLIENTSK
jgi:hypothetical protein